MGGGLVLKNLDVGVAKKFHHRELGNLEGAEFAVTSDEGATNHGSHAVNVAQFQGEDLLNFA